MGDGEIPFLAVLEGQRRALELTHRAVGQSVDVQRRAMRSFVDSVDVQRAVSDGASEFVGSALETSLLLASATAPGGPPMFGDLEFRFDEQLDALNEFRDVALTTFTRSIEDGFVVYERDVDLYGDAVDASFEAAIEGTRWMADELAGVASRGERPVEVDIEVEES